MANVKFSNITKRFGSICASDRHTFQVNDGEFFVLLGPTGAGKTTLLRMAAGLETPDEGQILFDGQDATDLTPAERNIAFVFQQYSLYPHLSVYDNLAFPLRSPRLRFSEDDIRVRIERVSHTLNIAHKLNNKATALSGGEMQRVAIGRALVRQPRIYLMDEPLSSLDARLRADLRVELKRIHKELGATFIYVTHDQIEAMSLADRIGIMNEGRLLQVGTPEEIYKDPNCKYVAERLGQPFINVLPIRDFECRAPEQAAFIGLRTEHVTLEKRAGGQAPATVSWIEHLGDQNRLHLSFRDHHLQLLATPDVSFQAGDKVNLALKNPLFFDRQGSRISI